jgi:hypothetical protein
MQRVDDRSHFARASPSTPAARRRGAHVAIVVLAATAAMAAIATRGAVAADVDPRALVLAKADLTAEYRLDRRQSLVLSNEVFSAKYAARLGRISGYLAKYRRQSGGFMRSRADVFRRPVGARQLLRDLDDAFRSRGRHRAGVGAEGWVYSSGIWAMVVWRHGRLLGVIDSWGLGKQRMLVFARLQQRRMAAALR